MHSQNEPHHPELPDAVVGQRSSSQGSAVFSLPCLAEVFLNCLGLQFLPRTDDNRIVPSTSFYEDHRTTVPFQPGALVIVTLSNPREKFWGAILHLSPEGLSVRGVDLVSFEDLVSQIKAGDPFTSGVVFFPMHRVERMELDLPEGSILSLAQRFVEKTGQDPAPLLVSEFLGPAAGGPAR